MLSSVLNSERAIEVNIGIMRTFVRLREMLLAHKDLARKLAALEKKYDEQFQVVFDAIRALMAPPEKPKKPIGFEVKEGPLTPRPRERRNDLHVCLLHDGIDYCDYIEQLTYLLFLNMADEKAVHISVKYGR